MKYETVAQRIPTLIEQLAKTDTQYAFQRAYIGEAAGLLMLLKDILEKSDAKSN